MYTHVSMHMEANEQLQVSFLGCHPTCVLFVCILFVYVFEIRSLTGLELNRLGKFGWPVSPRDLAVSVSPVLELQAHSARPSF